MAKFHGSLGFAEVVEQVPGVHVNQITVRPCKGDILRNYQRYERVETLNSNLILNNRFSVVGDSYTFDNIDALRYLEYLGVKWSISNIEIERPRLILTVGGVYNG